MSGVHIVQSDSHNGILSSLSCLSMVCKQLFVIHVIIGTSWCRVSKTITTLCPVRGDLALITAGNNKLCLTESCLQPKHMFVLLFTLLHSAHHLLLRLEEDGQLLTSTNMLCMHSCLYCWKMLFLHICIVINNGLSNW